MVEPAHAGVCQCLPHHASVANANEGWGPIIVKAAEQSMMMEEEEQMTAWRAEPARRQRLLERCNGATALAADKGSWFGGGGWHTTT
jgi:hypothetical protein